MSTDDDDANRLLEDECPGPTELESVMANGSLFDVVNQPPLVVETTASLARTIEAMQQERRGCVLMVDANKLVGVFTERDVLMKVAGRQIDLERTEISAYMTREPLTLPADSTVAFALNKMVLEGFRHIPLTDDDGRPIGVVSMRNLIEYLSDFFNRDMLNLPPDPHITFRNREGA
jgi:CBS domain-containing protein